MSTDAAYWRPKAGIKAIHAVLRMTIWAAVASIEIHAENMVMSSNAHHSRQSMPIEGTASLMKSKSP